MQQLGLTSTSTDPLVATAFGTYASNFGDGIVYTATPADMFGVSIEPGNVLAELESEVVFGVPPSEFAELASGRVSVAEARAILGEMGYYVPSSISSPGTLQAFLEESPRLTAEEIRLFVGQAIGGGGAP